MPRKAMAHKKQVVMGTQGCIWVLVRHSRNFLYQREEVTSLKMHLKLAHRRCLILVQK